MRLSATRVMLLVRVPAVRLAANVAHDAGVAAVDLARYGDGVVFHLASYGAMTCQRNVPLSSM
jgi:hypothetical protein